MEKPEIQIGKVSRKFLLLNIVMIFVYLSWWTDLRHMGNPFLYALLVIGEVYHIFMSLTFIHTVWPSGRPNVYDPALLGPDPTFTPHVDVFIPVAGEPKEVIAETARAARDMDYPDHTVYILNDGYVTHKDNWQDAEEVARELGIKCLTRKTPGGAKAGNINTAMGKTKGGLVALFDADMIPHPDFLAKTVPFFKDEGLAYVQTPQYYRNRGENIITESAWEQQEFFFGPILKGKDRVDSAFICGTNVLIRRRAIEDVGGFFDKSITEDFMTSLLIHQKGWRSHYVTEVLAEGLAPQDLSAYYKQQTRWAKGTLEVIFTQNPLFKEGLTLGQRLQYMTSSLFYFNGLIIFIDMIMPIFFFFFGFEPVVGSTVSFAVFFVPYMILNLYAPYLASDATLSYRALSFTHSSWFLQISALRSVLLREKTGFTITPKKAGGPSRSLHLVAPHLAYIFLGVTGSAYALWREGFTPAVATNIAWAFFNMGMFLPFIRAAAGFGNKS